MKASLEDRMLANEFKAESHADKLKGQYDSQFY